MSETYIVDLALNGEGKAFLLRDVKAGERLYYWNEKHDVYGHTTALVDVPATANLVSGHYSEGVPVIRSGEGTDDYLVVKQV